ncbi:hypothetical protein [Tsukamurella sp. PLM1]|uniref:hypothetical protein n=1 Tax=Tsukamurella sp. PLM1 TaxID=2929795 RepID=UPI0021122F38|nr:hypothetical protein [Tsukamurella sp. PLM1]
MLYGSPVPGYRAPQQTTDAAIRISGTFARVAAAGRGETAAPSGVLDRQLADVADAVTPEPTTPSSRWRCWRGRSCSGP